MTHTKDRNIVVDIERNRLRVIISHGEDEEIIKLSIGEARKLHKALGEKLEDYEQRQNLRID
ncbi:hypothetical protein [Methanohalophilus portucalensis]|uniref:Uncharacterized protein n=2 Tax=Methanohalophilus portucalensis TaxID=39664 RepID=A0A1L9C236_9EURY|nr:hypothetical protein [Methanohalophilus portucalensis]ATU07364.1 hypothetical protein BKM01_00355 [Methanohalophilus portucalensis]OJH48589.1 hypothetical protein MPF_1891 [Methanohalophilus portucalensis FDF-1]RNI09489.1 hypothetical protein EFE41_09250 [Methanohalophilus portucalensis FDF-1]SMH39886.1 hypothetical protein SAMN06264941_1449 [Methanohalophilus portucalensis FDF-1]